MRAAYPSYGPAGVTGMMTSWPQQTPPPIKTEDSILFDMLCSRMRWDQQPDLINPPFTIRAPKFQKICVHKLNPDTVVVFVVAGGKPIVIEDGAALFPSDTLVTQLRLLEENK